MDEFNPYATPAARSIEPVGISLPGYRLYLGLNLIYAVLILACLVILLLGGKVSFSGSNLLVIGIFMAPLLSCWWVVAGYLRLFRYWRFVQALIAGVLLVFCLEDAGRGALVGVGLFMTLVNALSLLASSYFYRLELKAVRLVGAVPGG